MTMRVDLRAYWHGLIMIGAPGAGKGTQAVLLSRALGIAHISSGDLFRENISHGTELGKLAKTFIDRGELVPDDVTIGMVRARLDQPDCAAGFILDGFPRTVPQADALNQVLEDLNKRVTLVPYIRVRDTMLIERLTHRWTCRACGAVFGSESLPPREGCKQDVCDGELYRRPDDNPDTQRRRIEVYNRSTAPLIDYYRGKGLLVEISGEHTVEHVHRLMMDDIRKSVGLY
ncbi:MAG: adenylate kinase [Thermoflexales bacterium]|nr:adenylate kinase [Thermoflexales bacterium]